MTTPAEWRRLVAAALPEISGDRFRDDEILDELAQHCADRASDLRASGVPADEIHTRVLAEVRLLAHRRAALRHVAPAARPLALAGLAHDIRYAMRLLWRTPAFSLTALLTLVLAIGGATAVFSVLRAVLLRPLPYPAGDRLVYIWEVSPRGDARNIVASGNVLDWQTRATAFAAIGAMSSGASDVALTGAGEPRRIRAARITPEVLQVFRPAVAAGRLFDARDGVGGAPMAALLTYRTWRRQFGGDADVVGRQISLDGVSTTIAGVLPPDVDLSMPDADVFLPLRFTADQRDERRSHNFIVVARLRDGTTRAQAQAEMAAIVGGITAAHPRDLSGWGVYVAGMRDDNVRLVRPMLLVLTAVSGLVLVIACANLANLQLVRASRRRAELAVRAAIGAGFGRLARQLMVEALLVSACGGTLALAIVTLLLPALVAAAPTDIPYLSDVRIDASVALFAMLVTTGCGLLIGLAPALMIRRADVQPLLQSVRTTSGRSSALRHALIAVQVGLALMLVVCASLLVKTMWRLSAVDFGFAPAQVLSVGVDLPAARYGTNAAHFRFFDDLLPRLRAIPGVVSAAGATGELGAGSGMTFSFAIEGRVAKNPTGREDPVPLQAVTPGYFETMKIPLVRGRVFAESDRSDAPAVVLINDRLARLLFPDGDAIGKRIIFRQGQLPWREIVGIVGDTKDDGLDHEAPRMLYVPFAQKQDTWRWMSWQNFVIRTSGEPASVLPAVRRAVAALDAELPLIDARPVLDAYAEQLAQRLFAMRALIGAAVLALVIGAVGIYGVLACAVAERRREIGIRRALGASAAHVVGAVVRPALVFAVAGAVAGIGATLIAAGYLRDLLFEVEPRDPAMFAAATAVLMTVAAVAAWLPARRALKVAPIETLRP